MKITLKNDAEQKELIKLMGSNNRSVAIEAQEKFAAAITPVAQVVLQQANVISNLYTEISFDEFTSPTIPMDLYFDVKEAGYIKVWSQTMPGGLATNLPAGNGAMPVMTYNLTSAVSFLKMYARQGRLDVVAKTLERMAQEILIKQEVNSASPLMASAAQTTYRNAGVDAYQGFRVNTANRLVLDDFNKWLTMAARINSSWVGGTPVGAPRGLTDIVLSPEAIESIRAMAYNPLNTNAGAVTNIPGTEKFRNAVYEGAGVPNIYGIGLIPCYEFGVGQKYNALFGAYAGARAYAGYAGSGTAAFAPATEEVLIGVDRTREALVSPVMTSSENGGATLVVQPDDQFYSSRSEKIGFWGRVNRGNVVVDSRATSFLIL